MITLHIQNLRIHQLEKIIPQKIPVANAEI
jgi:hypothetical protein